MIAMEKIVSPLAWAQVYALYRKAFPREERKPFSIIVNMHCKGKTDVWLLRKDGRFAGFATTINAENLILLDYLAVSEKMRGSGVGSAALHQLRTSYAGKGLFVEIESTCEKNAENPEERARRKQFYIGNGMQPMNVFARVFGVEMELLGYDCTLDFAQYREFYRTQYSEFAAKNILPV